MLKLSSRLMSLTLTLALFGNAPLFAQQHDHEHDHTTDRKKTVVNYAEALKDFDMKKAEAHMDKLKMKASERPGYLKYLKAKYIQKKYPDFVYVSNEMNQKYAKYKPDLTTVQKSMYCPNAGFEFTDFSNWMPFYGSYTDPDLNAGLISSVPNAGVFDPGARHTILTTPPTNDNPALGPVVGYDELAISGVTGLAEIPYLPPASSGVTCRLGNANVGAEAEQLVFPMTVTPSNTSFFYQFAVVLQDPLHAPSEQPYFQITVRDSTGNPVGGVCGIYNVNATLASSDPSFIQITYAGEALYYRKWELVGVDLSSLIGQDITIEFITADCSLSGHFGYAYIDADCGLLDVSASYCDGDATALLNAPDGFQSYQWYGPNSAGAIAGATDDTLIIATPNIGDTLTVVMESASGCVTTLSTVIDTAAISMYDVIVDNSCPGGASGSITVVPQGSTAGYTYLWNTGDTTATITNLPPGNYSVHIESMSGNCGDIDSTITVGVAPVLPSNATVNFCDLVSTTIPGPSGSNYQWYTSAGAPIAAPNGTNDTLTVTSPFNGQQFGLSYTNSQGCTDSTIYTLQLSALTGSLNANAGITCGTAQVTYFGSSGPNWTYVITGPGGYNNTISSTTTTVVNLSSLIAGTYNVTLYEGGCSLTATFTITLVANSSNTPVVACEGDTVTLTSPGVGVHDWYDNNGNLIVAGGSSSINVNDIPEGTFTDSVTTGSSCIEIYNFNVTHDSIVASFATVDNVCYGENNGSVTANILYSPGGTNSITWTGPDAYTGSGSPITSLYAGYYVATITNGNCELIDSAFVDQPFVDDTLAIVTDLCPGDPTAVLYAPDGYSNYQWYFQGIPISGATVDTLYITNSSMYNDYTVSFDMPPFGCNFTTTDIITGDVGPFFTPKEITNIFTPNKDGENDMYYPFETTGFTAIQISGVTKEFRMSIHNRWGQLMYETNDYTMGWDGKKEGTEVAAGVYFIYVSYVPNCADEGELYEFTGTVHLVR